MGIREKIHKEAKIAWLASNRKTSLYVAPRVGKTFIAVNIMKEVGYDKVTVLIPRLDIKEGWFDTFKKLKYIKEVSFVTFASIKHLKLEKGELLIIDEISELSYNQAHKLEKWVSSHDTLGLSGTFTRKTEKFLENEVGMTICYRYLIEEAVRDGILTDYVINVHKVKLDNTTKFYKNGTTTEKRYYDSIKYAAEKIKTANFLEMKMGAILQASLSKVKKTKQLIEKYKNQRILIFCGLTDVANNLEVPVYHSKRKDKEVLDDFCRGVNYKHLATVHMLKAGITVTPINLAIINYTSGNPQDCAQKICRILAIESANPDKKAHIHFLVSDEKYALDRAETALLFFDSTKITWHDDSN